MAVWRVKESTMKWILITVLFLVNFSWFSVFKFKTIMGDDLNSWLLYTSSHLDFWHYTFAQNFNDKYRPVFNAIEYLLFKNFGLDYVPYYYVNILVNFGISVLVFKIMKMITSNIYISFIFSLLFVTSRFSYYNITMLTGIMEAAALLLFLFMIYHSILFIKSTKYKHLYAVIFYYLLIIFTHERYLILAVFILSLIVGSKIDLKRKIIAIGAIFSEALFNILVKKLAFKSSVMLGTDHVNIQFDLNNIVKFVGAGILNMFGLNIGPEYLSGKPFSNSAISIQITSIIVLLIMMLVLVVYIKRSIKNSRNLFLLAITLVLTGSLLLAASITVRQEFRWLMAPYVVVLIFIAYNFILLKNKIVRSALIIIFVILSFVNNCYYRSFMYNTFTIYSQTISDSAYQETIKKYGQNLDNYTLYIEYHSDLVWPLLTDQFFKAYSDSDNWKVIYVDQLPVKKSEKEIFLKLDWNTKKLISVNN